MMLPKIYKVSAIIEPGKDAEGNPGETPESIKENILGGAYDQIIYSNLNLPVGVTPVFSVQIPKNTSLLKLSLDSADPEQAVRIMSELISLVSFSIEGRLQAEKHRLENGIKLTLIKQKSLQGNLNLLAAQNRKNATNVIELEAARKQALASPATDAMSLLLYSNEIQNQQIYQNDLQIQLETTQAEIETALIEIENARLKLAQVKGTNINKIPTASGAPIKPKKALIVALAFLLGLMGSMLLAFGVEFVSNARRRLQLEAVD